MRLDASSLLLSVTDLPPGAQSWHPMGREERIVLRQARLEALLCTRGQGSSVPDRLCRVPSGAVWRSSPCQICAQVADTSDLWAALAQVLGFLDACRFGVERSVQEPGDGPQRDPDQQEPPGDGVGRAVAADPGTDHERARGGTDDR